MFYANKREPETKCDHSQKLIHHSSARSQTSFGASRLIPSGTGGVLHLVFMKWFKHDSTAIKDEKIQQVIELFGGDGYMLYFGLLELCAEKLDEKLNPEIELSFSYIRKLFGLNRTKVELFLNNCSTILEFKFQINKQLLKISFPKLLTRLDNWTSRSVVTTEPLLNRIRTRRKKKEEEQEEMVDTVKDRTNLNTDTSFLKSLKENPAYKGIDVDREVGKLNAWLSTPRGKGKKLTRQRLVNWLNRCDQTMEANNGESDHIRRITELTK